ncbi:MAG: FkbM family methyltransferase [Bacteroidota bacterium]|nr:FkbM family methyltransferase [Bacteroidota bacterium]
MIIPIERREGIKKIFYNILYFPFVLRFENGLNALKNKISVYYVFAPFKKAKYRDEINHLLRNTDIDNPLSFIFPYPFSLKYDYCNVKVYKDVKNGLFYVLHHGKKLYYSRDYKEEIEVQKAYYWISIEQDDASPHRYINDSFSVAQDDVVVDIGAAEGNFSLEIIEKASKLFIFETDEKWIEALNATFEPWGKKVEIINKYVSDVNNETCIRLDNILENQTINFIKMDVEGAEIKILKSIDRILNNNKLLKLAICTYHRKNDAKKIEKILRNKKLNYSFSEGYMLFIYGELTPPYFRKGLVRAVKS